jgi:hypothetical protein
MSCFIEPWDEYAFVVPTPNTIDLGYRWNNSLGTTMPRIAGPGGFGSAANWTMTGNALKIFALSQAGWNVSFPFFSNGAYSDLSLRYDYLGFPNNTGASVVFSLDNQGLLHMTGDLNAPFDEIAVKPIPPDTWVYLQFISGGFWSQGNTPANSWRVYMNGEQIFGNAGGERTATGYFFPAPQFTTGLVDRILLNGYGSFIGTVTVDCNVIGASVTYIGEIQGTTIVPAALTGGICTNWSTFGAGTPYAAVAVNDGDTSYIYDNNFGDCELFTMPGSPLPSGANQVLSVTTEVVSRLDSTDQRDVVTIIETGGQEYKGENFIQSSSYQTFNYNWLKNPNTGLPFTVSDIDNLQFGVQTA